MSRPDSASSSWSVADSGILYQIDDWGEGYVSLNDEGHVVIRPEASPEHEIDLFEVVTSLRERDIDPPVLIRFSEILAHRLRGLHGAFRSAIRTHGYRGQYTPVYPIKVNQQRPVVEEVFRYGQEFEFGLEVGSKPELLAVMGLSDYSRERLIVCNGFKDESYLEAVVLTAKLGRPIVPVVERFNELNHLIRLSETYGVCPQIGMRAKLSSQGGGGRWSASAGEKSKFGLFAGELIGALTRLEEHGMLERLTLLHCHAGSQIQDIRVLKDTIGELAHLYCELVSLGANLQYIDIGGGLGVDYDGSRSDGASSINYALQEYADEVVYRIGSVCDRRGVEHPMIISESGRAMAAYQSVLVINALGRSGPLPSTEPTLRSDAAKAPDARVPQPIRDLQTALESVDEERAAECFHDIAKARDECLSLARLGYLTLEQRALSEHLFWSTCERVREIAASMDDPPEELEVLDAILSDTYFCNFSVFQSLPDAWAIGQLFPIMPIHRLDEKPTRRAVLADITCDSDGRVDRFVGGGEDRRTLEVHDLREDEDYYLAAFLVGAYQEILGDLHNLFGDTHVVHIRLHDEGGWWIEEVVPGDTNREVLAYVQYDTERLSPALARECELAIRRGDLTIAESRTLMRFYGAALSGYTYLTDS